MTQDSYSSGLHLPLSSRMGSVIFQDEMFSSGTGSTLFFLYVDSLYIRTFFFYKNVEAQINQNFKNMPRTHQA